jgi:carbamoylphosphate synthase large subunit
LREDGYETIMVNCNPETVSTDYDTSDRLYFEPLTLEDVLAVYEHEASGGAEIGMIVQFGGQTPLNLSLPLKRAGVPIIGTSPESIDLAEDRKRFGKLITELGIPQPEGAMATSVEEAVAGAKRVGYPVLVRPSYVLGGRAMVIAYDDEAVIKYMSTAIEYSQERPVLIDHFLEDAVECDVDALCDGEDVVIAGIMQHIEEAGIHSGDSSCVLPAVDLSEDVLRTIRAHTRKLAMALNVIGLVNIQFAIQRGKVFVIEVNPRASRTVPYVSKAVGVPLAKIASRLMVGRKLKELLPEAVKSGAGGSQKDLDGRAFLCEVAGVSVGQVSGRRYGAWTGDEVDRRGDGRCGYVWRGVCQGADRGGADASGEGHDLHERERPRQGFGGVAGADVCGDGISSGGDAWNGRGAGSSGIAAGARVQGERRPAECGRPDQGRSDSADREYSARAGDVLRREGDSEGGGAGADSDDHYAGGGAGGGGGNRGVAEGDAERVRAARVACGEGDGAGLIATHISNARCGSPNLVASCQRS